MSLQAEDYIAEYRDLGVAELVNQWEEPLPPEARALLLAELEARRYRIKSLPNAPDYDPHAKPAPPPTAAERASTRVKDGVSAIFFLGLFQIVVGSFLAIREWGVLSTNLDSWNALDGESMMTLGGELMSVSAARIQAVLTWAFAGGLPILLGVFFLVVYRSARARPRLGIGVALFVFMVLHGVQGLVDPSSLASGLVVKVFVIGVLGRGLLAYRDLGTSPEAGDLD